MGCMENTLSLSLKMLYFMLSPVNLRSYAFMVRSDVPMKAMQHFHHVHFRRFYSNFVLLWLIAGAQPNICVLGEMVLHELK